MTRAIQQEKSDYEVEIAVIASALLRRCPPESRHTLIALAHAIVDQTTKPKTTHPPSQPPPSAPVNHRDFDTEAHARTALVALTETVGQLETERRDAAQDRANDGRWKRSNFPPHHRPRISPRGTREERPGPDSEAHDVRIKIVLRLDAWLVDEFAQEPLPTGNQARRRYRLSKIAQAVRLDVGLIPPALSELAVNPDWSYSIAPGDGRARHVEIVARLRFEREPTMLFMRIHRQRNEPRGKMTAAERS